MGARDVVTPIFQGVAGNITGSLLNVGISALAVGAAVFGMRKAWQLFRHLLGEHNGSNDYYARFDYSGTYDDDNNRVD